MNEYLKLLLSLELLQQPYVWQKRKVSWQQSDVTNEQSGLRRQRALTTEPAI